MPPTIELSPETLCSGSKNQTEREQLRLNKKQNAEVRTVIAKRPYHVAPQFSQRKKTTMIDRASRNHWVHQLSKLPSETSSADEVSGWDIPNQADHSLNTIIEDLQQSLLMQLPTSAITDLGKQALEVHQHAIQRTILFLQTDLELPADDWSPGNLWLPFGIGSGVISLIVSQFTATRIVQTLGIALIAITVGIVWACYGIGSLLMGWHIFQVRILRRDLTKQTIAADERNCWPFESHEHLQAAIRLNQTNRRS